MTIARFLVLGLLSSSAGAQESQTHLDLRLPVVVGVWGSAGRSLPLALPKAEIEYLSWHRSSRFTLKAEHEAEVELDSGAGDHETKLEAELRRIPPEAAGWQPFVRAAVLADGELERSLSSISAREIVVGAFRILRRGDTRGSVELRIGYRDRAGTLADFPRAGMKVKLISPLGGRWRLNGEVSMNAAYLRAATLRISGDLKLYVLRDVGHDLQVGGVVFSQGSMQRGIDSFRIGIGPAVVFQW